ncbi:putative bifunctional diguanylate cyclase/phosphodiesterase [Alteromonas sp. MB-3u-76]|uniref:putative bifunctional diguanylate cyclase/phosphodiesterase n=1 Tax=Alteromonas sp. MB-3u-76 TaxID=2058133 RepID=UPI001E3D306A|nr:bifunctional diguanylate cyclase/phosphodiesterase [Alteromonas sp. MB-3u-76]
MHLNHGEATKESIKRDAVNMLMENCLIGLSMTAFCFSGLVLFFLPADPILQTKKLTLLFVMCFVLVARFLDAVYWRRNLRGRNYNPYPAFLRFSMGLFATGLIWASYTLLLFDSMGTIELAVTMVVIANMAAGGSTVLSPSKVLVAIYATALIIPMSLCALVYHDEFFVLGVFGIVFWFGMFASAFRYNNFFVDTVHLKTRNTALMEQMSIERQETEKVNTLLRQTNQQLDEVNESLEIKVSKRTEALFRLSNHDQLTGLLNRNGFIKQMSPLLDNAKALNGTFALLFIDLDGFKQVNDSLGHKVGDVILAETVQRLRKYCEKDHLGRWGGDEFVAVIPYVNVDTAKTIAQAMRSGINVPVVANQNQITLDATIGIAMFPEHGSSSMDLIQHADLTMYDQKRKQRGSIGVFNQTLFNQVKREQYLCEHLRYAIDNDELCVHYQPIIDVKTNTLSSVEALLRWTCEGENISPCVFIPLAEKSGMMPEIGAWVLNRALIDLSHWSGASEVCISVNVSIAQLLNDEFIHILDSALATTQVAPERLTLEITESVFANDEELVSERLQALVTRGVKISIDDFGTGFSSLFRLQNMPFNFIKIDRSFVQNGSEESDTIIRATLLMAKEFGCKTIAEGIETNEQREHLAKLGTDYLQGFYFAKPLELAELKSWYNDKN